MGRSSWYTRAIAASALAPQNVAVARAEERAGERESGRRVKRTTPYQERGVTKRMRKSRTTTVPDSGGTIHT